MQDLENQYGCIFFINRKKGIISVSMLIFSTFFLKFLHAIKYLKEKFGLLIIEYVEHRKNIFVFIVKDVKLSF